METIIAIVGIVCGIVIVVIQIMLIVAVLSIPKIKRALEDMAGRQQFLMQKILKAIDEADAHRSAEFEAYANAVNEDDARKR